MRFLTWLEHTSFPAWVVGSDSLLAWPTILFLHNMGMGVVAGTAFMVCLRLVGVATPMPVSSLRVFFRIFWWGFLLSLITGSILFASSATGYAVTVDYYVKMALIIGGLFVWVSIRKFVDGTESDGVVPSRIKMLAAASLIIWIGVITSGRLIAYVKR